MSGSSKLSLSYRGKEALVKTSLIALATTFEIVSAGSEEMQAELEDWDAGRVFSIGVLPDGPAVCIMKQGPRLVYMGQGHQNSRLKILFKNMDSAVMLMTGWLASHMAFAQHRAIVHGSVKEAVEANRVMAVAQKFLFPGLVLKMNFKRPPKLSAKELILKAQVMGTVGPLLALNYFK